MLNAKDLGISEQDKQNEEFAKKLGITLHRGEETKTIDEIVAEIISEEQNKKIKKSPLDWDPSGELEKKVIADSQSGILDDDTISFLEREIKKGPLSREELIETLVRT